MHMKNLVFIGVTKLEKHWWNRNTNSRAIKNPPRTGSGGFSFPGFGDFTAGGDEVTDDIMALKKANGVGGGSPTE